MKKNKTKNPLIKRVPRELKGDWSKYLLVSLFMIFVIGCNTANHKNHKQTD